MDKYLSNLGQWAGYVPMLALLGWAVFTDLRHRRIPNWASLALAAGGLAHALFAGPSGIGLAGSALGLATGLALPFVFFAINALGAGDVKLLAGIGAWMGPRPILWIMVASVVLGGVVAIVQGLRQRRLASVVGNTYVLATNLAGWKRRCVPPAESLRRTTAVARADTLPFAVPIVLAVLAFMVRNTLGAR